MTDSRNDAARAALDAALAATSAPSSATSAPRSATSSARGAGEPDAHDVARQIVEFCRSDSTTGQVLVLDSGVVYH